MRKITTNTFVSLDGIMQAPGGPEEDRTDDFKYGGWTFPFWDEIGGKFIDEYISRPFELLLGRKTYEIFAAYWPYIKSGLIADKFNATKKYVVTKTLNKLNWKNSFLIRNAVEEITRLKKQEGPELQVHGSANLIQTLLKNNLIDELRILTFPVVLGKGKRLFENGLNGAGFKLTNHLLTSTGVIAATYEPAGEVKTGSFVEEEISSEELERRRKVATEK